MEIVILTAGSAKGAPSASILPTVLALRNNCDLSVTGIQNQAKVVMPSFKDEHVLVSFDVQIVRPHGAAPQESSRVN